MSGYRPEGHEGDPYARPEVQVPSLGAVGFLRWMWRQLTSMRVALMLLMLLAVVSIPGSVLPQRPQDPPAVARYLADNPGLGPWLDRLGFFDVFASVWFSAVYLLLFVSLIGCIVPRTRVHLRALRARPPRVPRRLERFAVHEVRTVDADVSTVLDAARGALRGRALPRFRVDVHPTDGPRGSLSAERGYLRESGNLLFHLALVGILVSVATGQMLHYRGQALVVEGRGFANAVTDYDTFEAGTAFDPRSLVPFTMTLDRFEAEFTQDAAASPRDFAAHVHVREPGSPDRRETIRVNHPLDAGAAKVYLMGNGYAPQVEVRDAAGEVAFEGAVPFLPEDAVYTSRGVVKVPDVSTGDQIGLVGYLLPSAEVTPIGARSVYPQPLAPLLMLSVWTGDLGLDDGVPQNVYELDTDRMTQATEPDGTPVTLMVEPGQTVDLPDGLGTITFTELPRFMAVDLRHDPALTWILVFSALSLVGLSVSLFTPRRRVWVTATEVDGRTVVEAAALARGDDLGLRGELDRVLCALPGQVPPAPAAEDEPHEGES
ncbi:cytochrome c biogenesis protein ResB [Cellulomonas bogoriensis]|uniref:Cytochrome C biogenesis protein ResB n=1 Tax=Cellulomonas bogoriensis 69B4 = DSM 16987 TaxID=1386082 RepID=A0A0A0BNQ8_9CELL|nr:cytochrome c biogenesis protein ResB [Cellulomonas bogoriensis]KGM08694.1 cytochrome C biogenesis protein ResB [Cellulomonas bogoriensis 69B4 = DSM 16987]